MGQAGNKPAQNIEKEIPYLPHAVFYVIPEYKKYPHVGNQMTPSAMQKHICEKWSENRYPQFVEAIHPGQVNMIRNKSVTVYERFRLLVVQNEYFKYKNGYINKNQHPVNNGKST